MIGARKDIYEEGKLVRLLYTCCNRPLEIVVTPKGQAAADAIENARDNNQLRYTKDVAGHVVAVVGSGYHGAQVLNLVKDE